MKTFPILAEYLKIGVIRLEGIEFIGIASDGQEVVIGDITNLADTESYLTQHPTPETW